MVDEHEVNYWSMLAAKFGISTEAIAPAIETCLPLPASLPNASVAEQSDSRLYHQAAPIVHRETALSSNGLAN
jgi:hypothetical protein